MKMNIKKISFSVLAIVGSFLFLCGCSAFQKKQEGTKFDVYCVGPEETKVIVQEYYAKETKTAELIDELLLALATVPSKLEYKPPLSLGFSIISYDLEDGRLTLNMDEHYREMKPTTEVLARAAVVRTLTQIPEVEYVSFLVQGEPLTDSLGAMVGMMSADMFIDNAGKEINVYDIAEFKLYFASEDGTGLISATRRLHSYNTNIPIERLVVEQLIAGPASQSNGIYPTINPDTKVIGVSVRDGICYVNLSEHFLAQLYNVSSDVVIYSLVNTLVEFSNINKVQIAVNGETDLNYRENVSLTTIFERNLDLVVHPE